MGERRHGNSEPVRSYCLFVVGNALGLLPEGGALRDALISRLGSYFVTSAFTPLSEEHRAHHTASGRRAVSSSPRDPIPITRDMSRT